MAQKAGNSEVDFRPHFKTHQSRFIGEWFRKDGVSSITVSSLSMAEYFASVGWKDITVAFPVNLREINLINKLASDIRLGLVVEDPEVVMELESSLRHEVQTWIKIDTGAGRTGLTIEEMPVIRQIIRLINHADKLRFAGLLTHAGHTYKAADKTGILKIAQNSVNYMNQVRAEIMDLADGFAVSVGDTPSCSLMDTFTGVDEIRPGNFVFYDLMQAAKGVCRSDQIAAVVACPVVAIHEKRNQAVLYGGAVHFSKDFVMISGRPVYGQLVEMDDSGWYEPVKEAYMVSLSQEHGILEAPSGIIEKLKSGQLLGIIPVHACLTANLMRGYRLISGEEVDHF